VDGRRQGPALTAEYAARLAERTGAVASLDARHAQLATVRLMVFAVAALVAWLAFGAGAVHPAWLAVPALGFVALAAVHARVLGRRERAGRAVAFYQRGLARLEDRWQADPPAGSDGAALRPAEHLYADDLDLFGPGSLFALLSGARTHGGEARLAAWLLGPAPAAEVGERQAAVRDLAARLDLREDLAVLGPDLRLGVAPDALVAWATAPPVMGWPAGRAALAALSLATLVQVGLWIAAGTPPPWLGLTLLAHAAAGFAYRRRVLSVIRDVEPRTRDLALLAALLARVEREPFVAPRLQALRQRLAASGRAPSEEARRLSRLADLLASRQNQIFGPFSTLLFWATQLAFAVEGWRSQVGGSVAGWLDALAEFEALAALGTFAAEHPAYSYPELLTGPALVDATALAHPLLPADAVANDLALGGAAPALLLVSGSNMAGKSTLLRALGLNVVLAQAGAPVRAARLRLTPLTVGATLRIQDSLQAGRSRFFAEITRVRQVVACAQAAASTGAAMPPVLFLLDELFAGTNSHDRRHGAEAVLRGLLDLGAIGLATTHDLALTALAEALAPRAANVHLEDKFHDGELAFDYHLRPGVVQGSNALALMRSVGLEV
jgi:hypothetical protein